jgi:hypothetical protein
MKIYYGSGGMAPPLLTSALDGGKWSALSPGRFTPGEEAPVRIEYDAECYPEPVWTLYSREKSISLAGNRNPTVQPVVVAIFTELSDPCTVVVSVFL